MLRYDIKVGTTSDDSVQLDLYSISSRDYYDNPDKVEVNNIWLNDVSLYDGEHVSVVTNHDGEDSFGNRVPNVFSEDITIIHCDNVTKTFSFIGDKYVLLDLLSVEILIENTVMYLRFLFGSWHFFRSWENYGITVEFEYPTEDGTSTIAFDGCQYYTDYELRWMFDKNKEGIDSFMCSVFRNDNYELVEIVNEDERPEKYQVVDEIPETACFTDELYLALRKDYRKNPPCIKWELYEKSCNDGTLMGVSARRLNFRYNDVNNTKEYVEIPRTSVVVPLSLETGNNLYQEQNINDNFVTVQVEEKKNKSPEMEKFVYHPVFNAEGTYYPIHKIKFNLHFRERDNEGWIVKDDGYWNGMSTDSDIYGDVGDADTKQFFSYKNRGRQSDLLSYLGFTDSDVKYQKSKLKKSFLRLSYYDSPDRANQNLLCYSTLFIDTGKLFAKLMRGTGRKGLYVVSGQSGFENRERVVNMKYDDIKVNREPCFPCVLNMNTMNASYEDEDVEEYRLSSQFVVSDRLSHASAEGFYLYLWVDDDNGEIPSDIYMRVEFNHAGYGRIIPFTMPYTDDGTPILDTFAYVTDKWINHGGWGVVANERYSYVHFKYVYDKETKQHVYYPDTDMYGMESYDTTRNELELDLYEAKIKFE